MPRYGFNFQWMYSWQEGRSPLPPDLRALDFLAEEGLKFVRIPTDYHFWSREPDYFHPDESVLKFLDGYLEACSERGLHMSLNLHRAPGYCINGWDRESHNLWEDEVARQGFEFMWEMFARRYQGVSNDRLSFDLVNEPPDLGQRGFSREKHEKVIRGAVQAIRAIDSGREIVIDGLAGGNLAMPELADLGVVHSGRGYQPMTVSHYEAGWWSGSKGLPFPTYPGCEWDGRTWNRSVLEESYRPWREVESKGVTIHVGEFGCYDKTPNDVALRWFADLFDVFRTFGWGYAMWGFEGAFGIIDHGRAGAQYEVYKGYQVDRELLDLYLGGRTA